MVGVTTAVLLSSMVSKGPEAKMLPELQTHLGYARKCAEHKWGDALAASLQVISPRTLKVYVSDGASNTRVQAVLTSMDIWESSLADGLRFQIVSRPSEANVTVSFVDHIPLGTGEAGGYATWTRSVKTSGAHYSGTVSAQIKLAAQAANLDLSPRALTQAALHEFGHVLGLDDCEKLGSVMSALDPGKPVTYPTLNEIGLLRRIRSFGRQLTD